jgi:3-oxoacyl-[acyl-carrier-protein] synthase II
MSDRRVAITGLGAITSLGCDVNEIFSNLLAGKSGISFIQGFDTTEFPVKIGAEARSFDPKNFIPGKDIARMDRYCQLAFSSCMMAFHDAGITLSEDEKDKFGIIIGSGIGGTMTFENEVKVLLEKGPTRVSPFFIPRLIGNMGAAYSAIALSARGYTSDTVTACASGTNAIGDAFRRIKHGYEDFLLAGGAEAAVCPISVAGFSVMKALSKRNDEPELASRPFDKDRDGFVVGEGSGVLFLEEWEHAVSRGAKIYGEIVGYGVTCDAFHITLPDPSATQQTRCMALAIQEANISPSEVDYINAHGTSTGPNDATETKAIKNLFGEHSYKIHIHSTKSMIGHLLGAAGGVEAVVASLSLHTSKIHPTINQVTLDPDCDLDYTKNQAIEANIHYGLSNSFGFGGHNFCILIKKAT